jgi:hypothetical protein
MHGGSMEAEDISVVDVPIVDVDIVAWNKNPGEEPYETFCCG